MDKIKCKNCGSAIEITEALRQDIETKVIAAEQVRHEQELAAFKKQAEVAALATAKKSYELQQTNLEKELSEEKVRNKTMLKTLTDMQEELRALRRRDEERELELQQKLAATEDTIRQEERRRAYDESDLKLKEKDKTINDLLKQVEIMNQKAQQGSQQTQGEVLELEFEELLKRDFPNDKIEEVKKGQNGADICQTVLDKADQPCGIILWEMKNAKWSETWIAKLREDQRQAKAQLAILVTVNLPGGIQHFGWKDGVWITSRDFARKLAIILRSNLIALQQERSNKAIWGNKMETLYQYLTSIEFKHRIEAIVEAFTALQDDIEKEKRFFSTKWARQEKEIRKIVDHTHGLYGDFQFATERSLPAIPLLEQSPTSPVEQQPSLI